VQVLVVASSGDMVPAQTEMVPFPPLEEDHGMFALLGM
jgi:hypothetical protein